METITFYSYKGGVGRTLALANVAVYLSRFGQNVCIMDFDLEAPGLHYKFPRLLKTTGIKKGLVDCIYEFTQRKVLPKRLSDYSLTIVPKSKTQGEIRLIPAGNISSDYWKKLASIEWREMFYGELGEGTPCFIDLKAKIKKQFKSDFLLIDSRTGITEMSGICTSLLPDKVVFLIVNNRENIEGARQILRSIQKLDRLPGQKPIEVTFALARIPVPIEEKNGDVEKQIIKSILDFLNEPTEDLESQLNVKDMCVLHSDRDLELLESLRMGEKDITQETPLLREYLRLFSRIIPQDLVVKRLATIVDEITSTKNLLQDPDKCQKEIEDIAASYPHSVSLKKLINFYLLRNELSAKLLKVFHDLYEMFRKDVDSEMLAKYAKLFLKLERSRYGRSGPRFKLEMIEEYLTTRPLNEIDIELKLADSYKQIDETDKAIAHYSKLLPKAKSKKEVLQSMLDICIDKELYEDGLVLCEKYAEFFDEGMEL